MADINKVFAPHRGTAEVMSGSRSSIVLANGELFVELPNTGAGTGHVKIKIGDGKSAYSALPYALGDTDNEAVNFTEDTSTDAAAALAKVTSGASLATQIAALKKAAELTAETVAGANSFAIVTVNGTELKADSVGGTITFTAGDNVTLTPDANSTTLTIAAHDTTYEEATQEKAGLESAADKKKLNGIAEGAEVNQNAYGTVKVGDTPINAASKTATITLVAGDNVTLTPDATAASVTIATKDTTYTEATQAASGLMSKDDKAKLDGIEKGAQVNTITGIKGSSETDYRTGNVEITKENIGLGKVDNTADADKAVKTATKLATPVTIGLSNGVTGTATAFDGSSNITIPVTSVAASAIDGVIDLAHIPAAALERCVVVTDDTARFALTEDNVQLGDTVRVTSTNMMYLVTDTSALDSDAGYTEYTAATAAQVDWSGVQNKPAVYPPEEHTHLYAGSATAGGAATSALEADHAAAADKATGDGNGNDITKTYVAGVTASGTTVTVTYGNGDTKTFETQDNNTEYDTATTTADGLESAADKKKLDGIAEGAEVNQNAFANIIVGTTTLSSASKTGTFTITGDDAVSVTADGTTNTITVSAHDTKYSPATSSAAGLMSAADKAKLDKVSNDADAVSVAAVKITDGVKIATVTVNGTATPIYAPKDIDTHNTSTTFVAGSNTATAATTAVLANGSVYVNNVETAPDSTKTVTSTFQITGAGRASVTADANGNIIVNGSTATASATDDGLMSAADKAKLDSIASLNGSAYVMDFGEETA